MSFFDSHAHLADAAFDGDRDAVVQAAVEAGAVGVVCIGESRAAADEARALATRYPGLVHATAGVHPHDAATYNAVRDRAWIGAALDSGAVAIGECGLDYHYDNSPRAKQRVAFADQLALAAERQRPVVVHTRDADSDTLDMIRDAARSGVLGVLHCFTGPLALAEAALEIGWYVSFSGIVTFVKWTGDAVIRTVPADRILVETDAPYLAPVPVRGRRNESRFVPYVLSRLASVRGTPVEGLATSTTSNARRLFGLASDVTQRPLSRP